MEVSKNVFQSLSMDMSASHTKANHMLYNENFRVLTRENNNWVLTNIKGNKLVSAVTLGFEPVCIEVYAGIAYIISAEMLDGVPTGKGEIGTFPSPDYENGTNMKMAYGALRNYNGDTPNGNIQEMRSSNFNFNLKKAFSMVVEEDYDGTSNVIWTDGVNPMRIVNSRFTLRDDFTYEIIERTGKKDTNIYNKEDFETIINLITKVSSIMKVGFSGVSLGGRLLSGNYRYFFKLETQDGNQTNVLGESGLVSVFYGDSPGNTRGGGGEGLETEKLASFDITNIDNSYRYLRVYFVHSAGEEEPVERAFIIDQKYPIENGNVIFNHIGSEQNISIDISTINLDSQPIDTVGTLTKAEGYILAGDVTEKLIDYKSLIDFSKTVTVSPTVNKMHTYGKTNNGSDLFLKNDQSSIIGGTDSYNNAYTNPKNIYHKTGYGSGESSLFGVRFILEGGDVTQTFPVMGMDMLNGESFYPTAGNLAILAKQLEDTQQGFRETDGANIKGVLRFPNKSFSFDGQHLLINGVSFNIPEIPVEVKKATIGIQFMRGESNPDRITQGVFFNTMPIPVDDYIKTGRENDPLRDYRLSGYFPGYSENTAKWIPVYNYRLESPATWSDYGRGSFGSRKDEIRRTGIVPIRFNLWERRNLIGRLIGRETKFAFISPEIQTTASKIIGRINSNEVTVIKKSRVTSTLDCISGAYEGKTTFSLIRNISNTPISGSHKARSAWVVGADSGKNSEHFAGGCLFQAKTAAEEWCEFNLNFNPYVGLTFTTGTQNLGVPNIPDWDGYSEFKSTGTENHSVLADIYGTNGQRSVSDLKRIYANINSVKYYPISERLYWDESYQGSIPELSLANKIGSSRKIFLYGGDTYVGPNYRRLYLNNYGTYGMENFKEKEGESNLGETMMYFAESRVNSALRGDHTFDVSEYRTRTFYPLEATKKAYAQGDNFGKGNPWREYRLLETDNFNHGHRQIDYGRFSIAFPVDSPYLATRRRARVMHSAKFTANSFNNELRRWEGLNFVDYDSSLGRIIRLGQIGDRVMVIQERGISYVRLEERIASGSDSAGPVFFESAGVLPPKASFLSKMGTLWPESVIFTDMGVYGFDHESQYIWRYDFEVVKPMSKLSIDSHITKHLKVLKNKSYKPLSAYNVIASRDSNNEEILFTFRQPENPFTVSFSEVIQEFIVFYGFIPQKGFSLQRKFYTVHGNRNIFEHDRDDVPKGQFYGQQQKFKISFVVNIQVDLNKVFILMDIMSNNVFPDKITFRAPGGKTVENIVSFGPIYDVNAKFLENKVAVSIPKVKEVTNNDATEYGLASDSNNNSLMELDSRIRGQLMVVDLEYSNLKSIVLKSVLTYFNYC